MRLLRLDGNGFGLPELAAVAERRVRLALSPAARRAMRASRRVVDRATRSGASVYGVTTGFGKFADVPIPPERIEALQRNLIRSHAAGVGAPLPDAAVRAMIALRVNALARGYSGIRVPTVESLLAMLAADILPVVPSQGSVGASGDLAPLAHLALALIGEGRVRVGGREGPAASALRRARIRPVTLAAKEGLALINGVQMSVAVGGLALHRADGAGPHRRFRRGRLPGRLAGLGRGLRPPDHGRPPAPRRGEERLQPARAAAGKRDPGIAPGLRPRPGQLRPALHAAGARRGPRRLRTTRARFSSGR